MSTFVPLGIDVSKAKLDCALALDSPRFASTWLALLLLLLSVTAVAAMVWYAGT